MAEAVVGLTLEAKLDAFRQQMAQVEGISADQAKAMAAQFSKELKQAEAAAKKAADAAKAVKPAMDQAADATKRFGDASGKLGANAGKLAGFLGMISPEAAEAARGIADLADVGEVGAVGLETFGSAAVGLAPMLAILGGALWSAYNVMEDYTAATKAAEHAQVSFAAAMAPLDEAIAAAKDEQKLLNDALESGSAKKYLEIADLSAKADAKEAEATKELRAEKEALMETLAASSNMDNFEGQLAQGRIKQIDKELAAVHQKANEYARLAVANNTARKFIEGLKDETEKETKASKGATDAAKEQADAFEALAEAAAAENERVADLTSGIQKLLDQADDTNDSMLTGVEKITDDYDEQVKKVGELTGKLLLLSKTEAERESILAAQKKDLSALEEKYYADLDELRKKDAEAAKAAAQEKTDTETAALTELFSRTTELASDTANRMADAFGNAYDTIANNVTSLMEYQEKADKYLTSAQKKELKERIRREKAAAKEMFEAQKAAALADIAIKTAMGVMDVWSKYAEVPIVAALLSAPVIAAGAIQAGVVASQQPAFHKGGPLDLAPDEMSITARQGEYMLNPTGRSIIGDDALEDANAGKRTSGGGTPTVYAVSVYKHTRQVDRWKQDGLLQGDPISKAILAGKLVGHRSR